jgi:hypothetical protein
VSLYRAMMEQLDLAYPPRSLVQLRVDFVRESGGLPKAQVEADGTVYVTLRSIDWETEERVRLGRPTTERERLMTKRNWSIVASVIADGIEVAVQKLQEAPPFFVEESG